MNLARARSTHMAGSTLAPWGQERKQENGRILQAIVRPVSDAPRRSTTVYQGKGGRRRGKSRVKATKIVLVWSSRIDIRDRIVECCLSRFRMISRRSEKVREHGKWRDVGRAEEVRDHGNLRDATMSENERERALEMKRRREIMAIRRETSHECFLCSLEERSSPVRMGEESSRSLSCQQEDSKTGKRRRASS